MDKANVLKYLELNKQFVINKDFDIIIEIYPDDEDPMHCHVYDESMKFLGCLELTGDTPETCNDLVCFERNIPLDYACNVVKWANSGDNWVNAQKLWAEIQKLEHTCVEIAHLCKPEDNWGIIVDIWSSDEEPAHVNVYALDETLVGTVNLEGVGNTLSPYYFKLFVNWATSSSFCGTQWNYAKRIWANLHPEE
jgi:uncharacterized protein YciU (UPF0263 family)